MSLKNAKLHTFFTYKANPNMVLYCGSTLSEEYIKKNGLDENIWYVRNGRWELRCVDAKAGTYEVAGDLNFGTYFAPTNDPSKHIHLVRHDVHVPSHLKWKDYNDAVSWFEKTILQKKEI